MNPIPAFELADATFRYPESTALDSLTLSITPGQCVAVLGANGSGKSNVVDAIKWVLGMTQADATPRPMPPAPVAPAAPVK